MPTRAPTKQRDRKWSADRKSRRSEPFPDPETFAIMRVPAQMAELVDALVSGTSAARRGGSSPLLGTSFTGKPLFGAAFSFLRRHDAGEFARLEIDGRFAAAAAPT